MQPESLFRVLTLKMALTFQWGNHFHVYWCPPSHNALPHGCLSAPRSSSTLAAREKKKKDEPSSRRILFTQTSGQQSRHLTHHIIDLLWCVFTLKREHAHLDLSCSWLLVKAHGHGVPGYPEEVSQRHRFTLQEKHTRHHESEHLIPFRTGTMCSLLSEVVWVRTLKEN